MNAPLTPISTNPRRTAALNYAAMGWPVFPTHSVVNGQCTCGDTACKPKGKHPRGGRGFKDATRTKSIIHSKDWEQSNIGIATGAPSGVFVVDIDPRNGGDESLNDLEAANGKLPDTLTAKTGGGGRHFFFKMPAGARLGVGKLGPGIDLKHDGGYVIVSPSVTAAPYEWLDCDMPTSAEIANAPEWLTQLATSNRLTPTVTVSPAAESEAKRIAPLSQESLDEILSALDCIKDFDDRERWLQVGMALHSTGAGPIAFDLWTEWSKKSDKYEVTGQRTAWNSFKPLPDGITIRTLFKLATETGWQRPQAAGVDITAIQDQAQRAMEALRKDAAAIDTATLIEVVDAPEDAPTASADRIPGVLGQIEEYFNRTAIVYQPEFAMATSIALGSVALGRLYVARAWRDSYSSVFLCAVVRTGGGKEHIRTVIEDSLRAAELNHLVGGAGYTSAAAVFSTLLDQPTHVTFIDELGRHLEAAKKSGDSHQVQAITELMSIFGMLGGTYRYRRYALVNVADKDKENFRKIIHAPAVTLIGASTPSTFYNAVGSAGIVDGFLNRLLFFVGNDAAKGSAFAPRSEPVPLPPDVIAWLKKVRTREGANLWGLESHNVRPEPNVLLLSDRATEIMRDSESDVETRRTSAQKNGLGEVWVRTTEKAIRLSLIAAVSDGCMEIGDTHAEWAARRAIKSDAALEKACNGNIATTDHGKLCNAILRDIAKAPGGGLAEGKLSGACYSYRDASLKVRQEALNTLIADNRITNEARKTTKGHSYQYLAVARQTSESG